MDRGIELSKSLNLPFPLLSDIDHSVVRRYGVYDEEGRISRSAVVLIDRTGVVRWVNISEDYRVRPPESVVLERVRGLR